MKILASFLLLLVLALFAIVPMAGQGTVPPNSIHLPIVLNAPTATPTRIPDPVGEVVVLSSSIFVRGTGRPTIVGEVANQTNVNIESVNITATLISESGKVVATETIDTYIKRLSPGMTSGFYVHFPDTPEYTTYKLDLDWRVSDRAPRELKLSEVETYFADGGDFHIKGYVTNQTSAWLILIKVATNIYDGDDKIIGTQYYEVINRLGPGKSKTFDHYISTWAGRPDTSLVKRYTAHAYGEIPTD